MLSMAVTSPGKQSHPYLPGARADYTWSAHFSTEGPLDFNDIVLDKLGGLVTKIAKEVDDPEYWSISGAVLGSGEERNRTSLVLGLDPSEKLGTPSVLRCDAIAERIVSELGWQLQPKSPTPPEMRIIMGRRIGYGGGEYAMEDVRGLTVARGCGKIALTEADLFSLRYVNGKLREYHEPGVIVEGPKNSLDALLHVAADMGQERLVPEIRDVVTQVYFKPR